MSQNFPLEAASGKGNSPKARPLELSSSLQASSSPAPRAGGLARGVFARAGRYFTAALLLAALAFLAGCAAPGGRELWGELSAKGINNGFTPLIIQTPPFALSALLKAPANGVTPEYLAIYLEGDGRVLTRRGKLRDDPTPSRSMVFELARLDPAPAVLYLARIGQYQPEYTGEAYQTYWSEGRLSPAVVRAADEAVTQIKARTGAERIYLIGYSGGGGLACLLAARRHDVAGLVTVAGLLDHVWWTSANNSSPLSESLNPAEFADNLANIPQIHFYGAEDELITPEMSARFASLVEFQDFTRVSVPAGHNNGWQDAWPGLLQKYALPMRQRLGD